MHQQQQQRFQQQQQQQQISPPQPESQSMFHQSGASQLDELIVSNVELAQKLIREKGIMLNPNQERLLALSLR